MTEHATHEPAASAAPRETVPPAPPAGRDRARTARLARLVGVIAFLAITCALHALAGTIDALADEIEQKG